MGDHVGEQLGNYHLLRLLGRGSFADVYLGEHVYLHKPAALKVLHIRLGEQETAQFLQEARTLARLEHPHIVRVLDFAVQDGLPFLVMDYALGGTLRTKHPAGTCLPLETIVSYVSQVASALQYAHDQQLVHRDVKPENMLLDAQEQVKLSDFGLARLSPTHPASTQALDPALAGTAPYLAPEQVQGQPGPASDQYALGVVVYEWLCGQRPFKGTPIEVALQHVSAAPPPFHEQLPDLPAVVEEVVLRVLAKEPEERFPSVQDFATALQHAAHHVGDLSVISAEPTTSTGAALSAEPFWKVPTSFTSLVGREQDVTSVCAMLSRPDVRLLTMLGVGGIGKTRLSIQVASQLRDRFADGVCFVGLAPIRDPSLVISSIAHELGLQEAGAQPLVETVTAWLRDKHFLLLLDNFEQIVSAAPLLEDLLTSCPRLVILVTSREVLYLSAEHLFPVPLLSLPDLAQLPDHEQLSQYASVSLFLQRAQAIQPDCQLTPTNAHVIAEICIRLDGLPLAIELAAARIRLFPPQALLARLSQKLQLLTGGSRTLPERQQTLRNTIQWSYDLLDAKAQRLFRLLSVFVGDCTLEAIEAVCHAVGDEKIDVLNTVASLIDKSLLHQTKHEGEEPRLAVLETVREYGRDRLQVTGELAAAEQAHASFYLQLAEEAEPQLNGPEQVTWQERLESEHQNLRAAIEWALSSGASALALRLSSALSMFWVRQGYSREGSAVLEHVLAGSEAAPAPLRAKALLASVSLAYWQQDVRKLETLTQAYQPLVQELGDQQSMALARFAQGYIALQRHPEAAVWTQLEESLADVRKHADPLWIMRTLSALGRLAFVQGDATRGKALLEESLTRARAAGDLSAQAWTLLFLAHLALTQGELATAQACLEEGAALSQKTGERAITPFALTLQGLVRWRQGKTDEARASFQESIRIYREQGTRWGVARLLLLLAHVAAGEGDMAEARADYAESLAIAHELHVEGFTATSLKGLGVIAVSEGQFALATRLWGAAEPLQESRDVSIPTAFYEPAVQRARTQLGEQAFTAAWAEGRTMTPEQALAAQGPVTMSTTVPAGPSSVLHAAKAPTYPAGLTAREVEVLRLVAQGLSDAQIAEQLVISPRTVNWHLTSIYSKLQVSSRAAATRFAIEQHLV